MKVLKYTPTPKGNIIKLKRDVVEFTKNPRLIGMFSSEEKEIENEIDVSLVKTKTSFHPPRNRDSCLEKTIVIFTTVNSSNFLQE